MATDTTCFVVVARNDYVTTAFALCLPNWPPNYKLVCICVSPGTPAYTDLSSILAFPPVVHAGNARSVNNRRLVSLIQQRTNQAVSTLAPPISRSTAIHVVFIKFNLTLYMR